MSSPKQSRPASAVLTDAWYQGAFWLFFLAPLSFIYAFITFLRLVLYKIGLFSSFRSNLPVVVVGNITIGGTGKSPLVSALVKSLQDRGYRPGIISRGYGASIKSTECREVLQSSLVSDVGDEPLMLKKMLDCPIYVSPNRRLSAQRLESDGCDIVICDDGLQHYALQRDIEICVFDGARGIGNGQLLPMGPMRERGGRLRGIDFKVVNGADSVSGIVSDDFIRMDLVPGGLLPLAVDETSSRQKVSSLEQFSGKKVNAVAAIGNPERFFEVLERSGMIVNRYAFEDHHAYSLEDFIFEEDLPLIMTEKDAVKCGKLGLKNAWYMPVEAVLSKNLADLIVEKI